jgi:hypothetical protein
MIHTAVRREGWSGCHGQNDDSRDSVQMARPRARGADLLELANASSSSHPGILAPRRACSAPRREDAGDQADSRARGSNNTMSPGAFEATMRLRPVAFAL